MIELPRQPTCRGSCVKPLPCQSLAHRAVACQAAPRRTAAGLAVPLSRWLKPLPRSAAGSRASPDLAGPRLAESSVEPTPHLAMADHSSPDRAMPRQTPPCRAGRFVLNPCRARPRLAAPCPSAPDPDLAVPNLAAPRLAQPDLTEACHASPNLEVMTECPGGRPPARSWPMSCRRRTALGGIRSERNRRGRGQSRQPRPRSRGRSCRHRLRLTEPAVQRPLRDIDLELVVETCAEGNPAVPLASPIGDVPIEVDALRGEGESD